MDEYQSESLKKAVERIREAFPSLKDPVGHPVTGNPHVSDQRVLFPLASGGILRRDAHAVQNIDLLGFEVVVGDGVILVNSAVRVIETGTDHRMNRTAGDFFGFASAESLKERGWDFAPGWTKWEQARKNSERWARKVRKALGE